MSIVAALSSALYRAHRDHHHRDHHNRDPTPGNFHTLTSRTTVNAKKPMNALYSRCLQ
jgi:hypothetical protein